MSEFRIIFAIFSFIFGAVFASFAGVISYRMPKGLSIIKPDSYCPSCNKPIKRVDNIPILSWIFLGGKCRNCKSRIGAFSLLSEIFGGLGFMFAYLQYGEKYKTLPIFIALMLMIFLFLIIAGIDHETHDIYNITLILFTAIAVFITFYRCAALRGDIWEYVFGALFGFGFFGAIKLVAKLVLKKDALGSGDIYLVGIGGFVLGVFPLLISIIIATLLGSIIEIIKIKAAKTEREAEIAFGPYLLLGMGLMAIFGESFMKIYWEVLL